MVKRISNEGEDGATAYRKRQKVVHEAPTSEEVYSADQLRNLLTFDQDLRNARHGMSVSNAWTIAEAKPRSL